MADGRLDASSYASFQTCINDAVAQNRAVYLPKGTYVPATMPLIVPTGATVRLEGDGEGISVISFPFSTGADGFLLQAGATLVLRDMSLVEGTTPVGFRVVRLSSGSTSLQATRCTFTGNHGIRTEGGAFLVELRDCTIALSSYLDVAASQGGGRLHLTGCRLSSTGDDAVRVANVIAVRTLGCSFTGAGGSTSYAIRTTGSTGLVAPAYWSLQGTVFTSAVPSHVLTNNLTRTFCLSCSFQVGAGGTGLHVQGDLTMVGCSMHGNQATHGIRSAANDPAVDVVNCMLDGSFSASMVTRDLPAPLALWAFDQCLFANTSGRNINSDSGPMVVAGCMFTDATSSGEHAWIKSGNVRFSRCRVWARPLYLNATLGDIEATVEDCSFMNSGKLRVAPGSVSAFVVKLLGGGNDFEADALQVVPGAATRVLGAFKPRAARGPDIAAASEISLSPGANLVKVTGVGPVQRMKPGGIGDGARLFEGPYLLLTEAALQLNTGGAVPGKFESPLVSPSTAGEVRGFVVDRATGNWREV